MEERIRTRARALAQGVEAQMLALGAPADLARAWRDWTYECVVETAGPPRALAWPADAPTHDEVHGASLSS